jgi:hypothetical protein
MEPIQPQIRRSSAYREYQDNKQKVLQAGGWLLGDAREAAAKDPENATAIKEKSKAARAENEREIATAYAVKGGFTMKELADRGKDIEVSGDALRRAKTGQKPKIQTVL